MKAACGIVVTVMLVSLGLCWASSPAANNPIENGSFEIVGPIGDIGAPRDWEGLAMGTIPAVVRDCEVAHDGRCSLKVISDKQVLTNAIQTVTLEPDQAYVLTGWIKTDKLEVSENADMYGTLVVVPEPVMDENLMVKGPNHNGTTDWVQVRVDFKSSPDGKMNILCSYCGQGVAKGTVWFDDLRIVPASQAPATSSAPAASRPASRPASKPAATQPGMGH
ncbi:MAG TPA: hypothetical protein VLM89_03610 [Phycisphaerae bacterium]|nr:hypothetical protein [Phycisphaerae bacterium]